MVHSDGFRNNLELQSKILNMDAKWCILTAFETIWNCRKNNENRVGKWCIQKVFEMIILKQGCLRLHYYIF